MAEVPTVIESSDRGDRAFDLFSRLLRDRIVFLGTPVDDNVANLLIAQFLFLESEDSDRDVSVYINSPGGSATAMFALYDVMNYLRCDIATYCMGMAASAAAVLLAAGTNGKRYALPNARVLIHQPHGSTGEGQAADIEIAAKEILRQRQLMNDILARHTGKSVDVIAHDTDRDFIMGAEDARAYGLVDHVLPAGKLGALSKLTPDQAPGSNGKR